MGRSATRFSRWRGALGACGLVLAGIGLALPFRLRPSNRGLAPPDHPPIVDVPLRRSDVTPAISPPHIDSPAAAELARQSPPLSLEPGSRPDLAALGPLPALPHAFGRSGASEGHPSAREWKPVRLSVPGAAPKLRRHRLTDGDTLERLADRYLGSGARAEEIYAINRDLLTAPDLLPLGRIIRIPAEE